MVCMFHVVYVAWYASYVCFAQVAWHDMCGMYVLRGMYGMYVSYDVAWNASGYGSGPGSGNACCNGSC